PTTRRGRTRCRSSSPTGCGGCTGRARSTRTVRTSSTTSRSTTSRTSSPRCPWTRPTPGPRWSRRSCAGWTGTRRRPRGARAGGRGGGGEGARAQILASGVAVRWALEAQRLLAEDWGVAADVWSATSWTELRRDALACEEWNLLNPDAQARVPYVTEALEGQA